MTGDFSRNTFDRSKHYRSVRWQQGRPTTDADLNEAQDITSNRIETEASDVIGQAGAPRQAAGFELSFDGGGALQIGPGRLYVDGLLCENDHSIGYANQPALPDAPVLTDLLGDAQLGLVYLDVFSRHVTYQDDPQIREVALNGVDTSTRLQTVWQVKLLPLDSVKLVTSARTTLVNLLNELAELAQKITEASDPTLLATLTAQHKQRQRQLERVTTQFGVSCGSSFPEWDALLTTRTGALSVTTIPGGSPSDPCDVPPGGGYTRGENQFYRVQVHTVPTSGSRAGATFKWSRDNGSVCARITAVGNAQAGTASGTVFDVDSVQRDDYLGIHTDDIVEYVDDRHELLGLPGELRRVTNADVNLGRITLESSLSVNLDRHPRLRKWDLPGTAPIALNTTNSPIPVEHGIQVEFADGTYRAGDYWQFAARAVDGSIDFPAGPQPAAGVTHHYARLGLLLVDGQQLRMLQDCRPIFPALTGLTASDVGFDNTICTMPDVRTVQDAIENLCARTGGGGTCTFTVAPGPTWFEVFQRIEAKGNAEICFGVGVYELAEPVVIENKGHLRLHGAGNGTRIVANAESALIFRGCESVSIEAMAVEARRNEPVRSLNGAISCEDCRSVTLESVSLRCAAAILRSAACLRVMNQVAQTRVRTFGLVDVRNCTMLVGHNQIGILVTNCSRTHIDNTIIRCIDGRSARMRLERGLNNNLELLAEVRRTLYSDIQEGRLRLKNRENLTLANTVINMRVDPLLIELKFFDQLREFFSPEKVRDLASAKQYLREAINTVLLKPDLIPRFPRYYELLLKHDVAALYQGITIGGEQAEAISITNCTISDALQGIHIGQSTGEREDILRSGTVRVAGNHIQTRITPTVNRGSYGILVGNCDSMVLEANQAERNQIDVTAAMAAYGLYAAGHFGRRLIMRHNHTDAYTIGLVVDPRGKLPPKNPEQPLPAGSAPLWLIADNVGSVRATSEWVRVEGNVA